MRIHNGKHMDISDIPSHTWLQINSCGIQHQLGQGKLTFRKEGRCDYHIVYIADGASEVEYAGNTTLLKHGFVLYPPHMLQRYIEHDHTRKLWIHFNGYYVEEILKEYGLNCGVHHMSPSPVCEKLFVQLVAEHNQKAELSNEKALLLTFLNMLGKSVNHRNTTNEKIEEAISFITTHYTAEISISELAESCNVSQSRFLYLFKEKAGQSPHAYQQMLRIHNSMTLLASTKLQVTDISALSGYADPLYFSRVFRKYTGMSPKAYRQAHLEEQHLEERL